MSSHNWKVICQTIVRKQAETGNRGPWGRSKTGVQDGLGGPFVLIWLCDGIECLGRQVASVRCEGCGMGDGVGARR